MIVTKTLYCLEKYLILFCRPRATQLPCRMRCRRWQATASSLKGFRPLVRIFPVNQDAAAAAPWPGPSTRVILPRKDWKLRWMSTQVARAHKWCHSTWHSRPLFRIGRCSSTKCALPTTMPPWSRLKGGHDPSPLLSRKLSFASLQSSDTPPLD